MASSIQSPARVIIYADVNPSPGKGDTVSTACVQIWEDRLKDIEPIVTKNYSELSSAMDSFRRSSQKHTLLIPGGNALHMQANFPESFPQDLRQKIQQGKLNIFGSCAGAILLSEDMGYSLVPYKPVGRFPFGNNSRSGRTVAVEPLNNMLGERIACYYNSGLCFNETNSRNIAVTSIASLARYPHSTLEDDKAVAGYACQTVQNCSLVGLGFHPEVRSSDGWSIANLSWESPLEKVVTSSENDEATDRFLAQALALVDVPLPHGPEAEMSSADFFAEHQCPFPVFV